MILNKDTWHYRNFRAWQRNTNAFRHRDLAFSRRQPDLCTYVRIALFYGPYHRVKMWFSDRPIIIGAFWTILFYAIFAYFGYLIARSGDYSEWFAYYFPLLILVAATLGILVVGGVFWTWDTITLSIRRRRRLRDQGLLEDSESKLYIITEYAKTKKRKVCPLLEFEDDV